jgi:hypothetical protein
LAFVDAGALALAPGAAAPSDPGMPVLVGAPDGVAEGAAVPVVPAPVVLESAQRLAPGIAKASAAPNASVFPFKCFMVSLLHEGIAIP